jgi:uncharacterized protein YaaQ
VSGNNDINQLVFVTVVGAQSGELMRRLSQEGFYFTEIDSMGGLLYGMLQEPSACLMIGLNQDRLLPLFRIIEECCHTRRQYIPARVDVPQLQLQPVMIEAELGGATVYALEVEKFEQL